VCCTKGLQVGRFQCHCGKCLALAASLVALMDTATVSPAAAEVTIGSNLARVPDTAANYSPRPTFSNVSLPPSHQAPGGLSSPVNGTVVQWRIRVGNYTRLTSFRVIRPLGKGLFTGAGTSPAVTPPVRATTSYGVRLPIQTGDYIGIDCCELGVFEQGEFFVTGAGAVRDEWQPSLADGGPGRPPLRTNPYEIALNAQIDPASAFTLGPITHNKKRGTAKITAKVPNPGELTASGRGVKLAHAAANSKWVRAPGKVRLLIKAKGRKKRKLNATGKVKLHPEFSYTPMGGRANTQGMKVRLIKR
jgi:hypothetical protein